ncbi:coiled-coil domain-containing protein [Olsenella profusa]|nr:hypothetical protein [Olsenella profusa]
MSAPVAALADEQGGSSDSSSSSAELDQAQSKINDVNAAYEDAVARVEELQGQIDANEQRISDLEGQLPSARGRAAESMRTLYKMQQSSGGLVELILSAGNFYDLLSTVQYLDVIQSHSTDAVNELASISQELEQTRASLDAQMQEAEDERAKAEEALAEAVAARQQLEAEIAAQAAAEEAERQAAIEQARAELEAAQAAAEQNSSEGGGEPTFVTESGNQAEVEVPASPDPGTVDWDMGRDDFIATWTARIDAYLAGSPLAGQGATFAEAAWEYGCDPRFSPAIAMVESSLGRYCFLPYNAWGWGSSSWSNWEDAIWDHVAGLASIYGGHLTYAGAQMYCPPNAAQWYSSVLANMERI